MATEAELAAAAAAKKKDEVDPRQTKAEGGGWRPKEEWTGDPAGWVDYNEFNVRGELMGRIQEQSGILGTQKNKIDDLEAAMGDLMEMNEKTAEREYNRLLKQLKAAKAEAIENSEGQLVADIDEDIATLKETRAASKADPKPDTGQQSSQDYGDVQSPDVRAWLSKPENQWFNTDRILRGAASALMEDIVTQNPGIDHAVALARMDKQIRAELPHKFKGSPVDDGSGDQNRGGSGHKQKGRSFADLDADEQNACKRFVKLKVFASEQEYIDKLDGVGE